MASLKKKLQSSFEGNVVIFYGLLPNLSVIFLSTKTAHCNAFIAGQDRTPGIRWIKVTHLVVCSILANDEVYRMEKDFLSLTRSMGSIWSIAYRVKYVQTGEKKSVHDSLDPIDVYIIKANHQFTPAVAV